MKRAKVPRRRNWCVAASNDRLMLMAVQSELLVALKGRVQKVLDEFKGGAFVKLSSRCVVRFGDLAYVHVSFYLSIDMYNRSPKDASAASQKTRQIFRELVASREAAEAKKREGRSFDHNDALIAINQGKVKKSKMVLILMLMCNRVVTL